MWDNNLIELQLQFISEMLSVSGVADQKPGEVPDLHGAGTGQIEETVGGPDTWPRPNINNSCRKGKKEKRGTAIVVRILPGLLIGSTQIPQKTCWCRCSFLCSPWWPRNTMLVGLPLRPSPPMSRDREREEGEVPVSPLGSVRLRNRISSDERTPADPVNAPVSVPSTRVQLDT